MPFLLKSEVALTKMTQVQQQLPIARLSFTLAMYIS